MRRVFAFYEEAMREPGVSNFEFVDYDFMAVSELVPIPDN